MRVISLSHWFKPFSLERYIAHASFVIPGKTIFNGSQGDGAPSQHRPVGARSSVAPDRRQSSGQRDRARARARSQRCLKCQLCEGAVGVKVFLNTCLNPRRSAFVAIRTKCGWALPPRSPGYSQLWQFGEDDAVERSALEAALKKAQTQAVIPPVAERIEQTQKFIERARKRVSVAEEYVQWAQDWKVECEKELSEAEERLWRLRFEAERPVAAVPDSATGVQRLQQQLAEAQAQLHQQGSVSVTTEGPAKRPRRREDFMCSCAEEVIKWISDRQSDIQEEIKKGNTAEVARLSSLVVQAATNLQPVHTSMVAQFVPTPVDFFCHRKLDDSVIGQSARTVAKYGHRWSQSWRGQPPRTTKIIVEEARSFRNWRLEECGSPESNGVRRLQRWTAMRSLCCHRNTRFLR